MSKETIGIHYSLYAMDNVDESKRYFINALRKIKYHEINKMWMHYDFILHIDQFSLDYLKSLCEFEQITLEHVKIVIHPRNVQARGQLWRFACVYDKEHDISISAEIDGKQNVDFAWELIYMISNPDIPLFLQRNSLTKDFKFDETKHMPLWRGFCAYNVCVRPNKLNRRSTEEFMKLNTLLSDNLQCVFRGLDEIFLAEFIRVHFSKLPIHILFKGCGENSRLPFEDCAEIFKQIFPNATLIDYPEFKQMIKQCHVNIFDGNVNTIDIKSTGESIPPHRNYQVQYSAKWLVEYLSVLLNRTIPH